MTEDETKAQFAKYKTQYASFKDEVLSFLGDLKTKHTESVEIYSITGRIKTLESIFGKISQAKGKYAKLTDVQDVSGTRIVCHCRSDLDRFDAVLTEQLEAVYPGFKKTTHERDDGYRGIHYVLKKNFSIEEKEEILQCEIQLRTVLQDAWAIQSHVFGYKKKTEGDANILKQAMSGILDNCETLWELVKRDANGEKNVAADEVTMIYQNTTEKVTTINKEGGSSIEKLVSENKLIEIEDALEIEFKKIKEFWTNLYTAGYPHTQASDMLEKLEPLMNNITVIGLLSIKHDKLDVIKKVFRTLEKVSGLAEHGNGYTNILSIPSALLHNSFYYFGIYATKKLKGSMVDLIINETIEKDYNGKLFYSRVWESASYMAPEVIHGVDKMFNRLIAEYPKNEAIKEIINVNEEEFITLAITFNMIFCLKGAREMEDGKREPWAFPNFGRYYGFRIQRFIERIKNKDEYQQFITKALKEDLKSFSEKFDLRISKMAQRGLGSGYFWSADLRWNDK